MRNFRIPLLVALIVSLGLGLGLGWKLRRDRAAELGVVTSSRKLRILALTGSLPPVALRGFRSAENIQVELIEEPTPDAVFSRLESDPGFDLVTLLTSQMPRASQNGRIQPFIASEIATFGNISRDFIDLPQKVPTEIPFLWGVLGFVYKPGAVGDVKSWADVFNLGRDAKIVLKPMAVETKRLAQLNMPTPFAENALQDRIKKFNSIYKKADRFIVDTGLKAADGDLVEVSFCEATIPAYRDMDFVLPTEPALLWILNLAMTASAKNIEEAKTFATYLLKPDVAIAVSLANHEASTNTGAESSGLLPTQKPSSLRRIPLTQLDFSFDDVKN